MSPWVLLLIAVLAAIVIYFMIMPRATSIEGFVGNEKMLPDYYNGTVPVMNIYENIYYDQVNGTLIDVQPDGIKIMTRNGEKKTLNSSVARMTYMMSKDVPATYTYRASENKGATCPQTVPKEEPVAVEEPVAEEDPTTPAEEPVAEEEAPAPETKAPEAQPQSGIVNAEITETFALYEGMENGNGEETKEKDDEVVVIYVANKKNTTLTVLTVKDAVITLRSSFSFTAAVDKDACTHTGAAAKCDTIAANCPSGYGMVVNGATECCECPESVRAGVQEFNQEIAITSTQTSAMAGEPGATKIANEYSATKKLNIVNPTTLFDPEFGNVIIIEENNIRIVAPSGNDIKSEEPLKANGEKYWYRLFNNSLIVYASMNNEVTIVVVQLVNNKLVATATHSYTIPKEEKKCGEVDTRSPEEKLQDRIMSHMGDKMIQNIDKMFEVPGAPSDDFILKTQIVPPVCPQCPSCAGCTGVCTDCGGKGGSGTKADNGNDVTETHPETKITNEAKKDGNIIERSIDAAGNVVVKTVDTAGNLVIKTFDEAGNVIDKTIGPSIRKVGEAGAQVAKDVYGAGKKGLQTGVEVGTNVAKDVYGAGKKGLQTGIEVGSDVAKDVYGAGKKGLQTGVEAGTEVVEDVYGAGKKGAQAAGSVIGDVYGGVKTVITDLYSGIKGLGSASYAPPAAIATQNPSQIPTQRTIYNTNGPQVNMGVDNRFGAMPQKSTDVYVPITADFSAFGR